MGSSVKNKCARLYLEQCSGIDIILLLNSRAKQRHQNSVVYTLSRILLMKLSLMIKMRTSSSLISPWGARALGPGDDKINKYLSLSYKILSERITIKEVTTFGSLCGGGPGTNM